MEVFLKRLQLYLDPFRCLQSTPVTTERYVVNVVCQPNILYKKSPYGLNVNMKLADKLKFRLLQPCYQTTTALNLERRMNKI